MLSKTQKAEYARRRRALMRSMKKGAMAIIPAAPQRYRNRHLEYRYRQDSDFFYLSGFVEPDSVMVLIPGREQAEYILFCREKDPQQEMWHGRRVGVSEAPEAYGVDDAFPIDDIDDILPGLLEGRDRLFYTLGKEHDFDQRVMGWVNKVRARASSEWSPPTEFIALDHLIHEMRVVKSRHELSFMRRAAKVTCRAHRRAMQRCGVGSLEYELEAELISEFRNHNAEHAYLPIVGGGENGCILHYLDNAEVLNDGDLVLIDAGCEIGCYASDVTRTFPVNGVFSDAQCEIYSWVLRANKAAIESVKPGVAWNVPHDVSVEVLTRGLIDMGVLKGSVQENIKSETYREFYMHRVGHWLGLDVHDVGEYKINGQWRNLEPGMAITIEPGLYMPNKRYVPKRFRNIGIRIEDDVVVTKEGHEVLTREAPKSIEAIEALMAGAL